MKNLCFLVLVILFACVSSFDASAQKSISKNFIEFRKAIFHIEGQTQTLEVQTQYEFVKPEKDKMSTEFFYNYDCLWVVGDPQKKSVFVKKSLFKKKIKLLFSEEERKSLTATFFPIVWANEEYIYVTASGYDGCIPKVISTPNGVPKDFKMTMKKL